MSRPAHRPDPAVRRQVEAMAGYGVPEADIAGVVGIDPKTLRKHYRGELDNGHVKANAKVAENLYLKATGEGREAVTAAIFWLKARAGWKETMVNEVTHGIADPLQALLSRIDGCTRGVPRRHLVLEHSAAPIAAATDNRTSMIGTVEAREGRN